MWHRYALISLLLLGALSIGLKMSKGEDISQSHKREIKRLTQYMNIRGLMPSGTFDLNKEGSFVAHI